MTEAIIADINSSGIYQIRNIVNGKRYIGSAVCFRTRWAGHRSGFKNENHPNSYLRRSLAKYGADAFAFEIIEACSIDELIGREQSWIDAEKPEYNLSPTAGSCRGVKHSVETRRKISDRNTGNKFCVGRVLSEASKRKISEANIGRLRGRKQTPEQVAAKANSHRGMKRSEETRRKISESRKGKKLSKPRSAEYREKMSADHKGRVIPAWQMERLQAGRAARVYTDEQRDSISRSLHEAYETGRRNRDRPQAYREKIAAGLRGRVLPDEVKGKLKAKWADPGFRERMKEAFRKGRLKRSGAQQ